MAARGLLHLSFSTCRHYSTAVAATTAASQSTIVGDICRILSDHRSPHHDLESFLSPFSSFLTHDVVDNVLRRCHHLPSAVRRFYLFSSPLLPPSPTTTLSILLNILAADRQFALIWAHLSDIPAADVSPSHFHILFRAYARAGLAADAIRALRRMLAFGITPSSDDVHQLISSLCRYNLVSHAQEFFDDIHNFIPNFQISQKNYTVLMSGWSDIGKHDTALKMFDKMLRRGLTADTEAYNTLLSVLCRMGRIKEAYNKLNDMQIEHGLEPNASTYGVFIRSAACDSKDSNESLRLLDRVRRRKLLLNVHTYNCVINLLCDEEKIEEAYTVIDEMIGVGVKPDVRSYNGIISVHCKHKEVNKAMRLLARMDKDCCLPDRYTYNMLLKMLLSAGRIDRAMEVWGSMEKRGFYPSAPSYSVMIHGMCRNKNWIEQACRFFEAMVDEGIPPYCSTCELLRSQLLRLGMAERVCVLADKMRMSTSSMIQELVVAMEGKMQ